MAPKGGRTFLLPILFLLAPVVSAMPPDMMSHMENMMPDRDPDTSPWFPWFPCSMSPPLDVMSMTPHLRVKARSLMMRCLQMGHRAPVMIMDNPSNDSGAPGEERIVSLSPLRTLVSLLSSLPSPDPDPAPRLTLQPNRTKTMGPFPDYQPNRTRTMGPFLDSQPQWNVTELMWNWNCSSLLDLIKLMRNSSEGCRCFLRAFAAPLSWEALKRGSDDLDPEDYGRLVWAAKPLLQNMPPHELGLPPRIQGSQLRAMMKMMREVFGSLSEDQQDQIKEWVKQRVAQNHHNCSLSAWRARPRPTPEPGKPPGNPLQLPVMPPRCPSRLMWLETEVMKMMGPFLTLLPADDMRAIPKGQLCPFFSSPEFSSSFRGRSLRPQLGRKILRMVRACSHDPQELPNNLDRLGSLACFYDDVRPLTPSISSTLLSQLENCSNPGVTTLKKRLARTVMSLGNVSGPALLRDLGVGVTELSPAYLASLPPPVLRGLLASLGPRLRWRLRQARSLARTLLPDGEGVSNQVLMSLGSAVRGVASKVLRKVKPEGLLGSNGLQSLSQKMSKLQKIALLEGLAGGVNASELVNKLPAALLSRLSLTTLDQADLTSLHQLEGRSWTLAQAAFLVRSILGKVVRPGDVRKLGAAVQGVACNLIDSVSESDAMEMAQSLTETPQWLTRTQVRCTARKLFASLERRRDGYFNNITEDELHQIPTLLLLHLSPAQVDTLPEAVCSVLLEKTSQADLSRVSLRSRSRPALTNRALRCLLTGRSMSDLSSEEVLMMGSLLCELHPSQLSLLDPEALNSTLEALASCPQIPPPHRGALVQLVKQTYGDPSDWSVDTMESLGPLLLLDDSTVRTLRYRPWLKAALSDMMDPPPPPPGPPPPPDFSRGPDLSALRWKLFSLSTVVPTTVTAEEKLVPLVSQIEDLGVANVYWSPAQLCRMPNDTFIATVETLGAIPDYSPAQLSALRQKSIQAFGPVEGLDEDQVLQLRCICQGFNLTELPSLPISSLDTLETLAPCAWTQAQRETLWEAFAERTGVKVGELGAVEMVGLDQFICGLGPNASAQLNPEAFREALGSVGQVQCPLVVTEGLKNCALAVFGQPSNWTQAQVNTLGNIMAGLSSSELRSLSPSVLPFLSQTSVPLIPADRLAALLASQLEALGPDNAAMVTDAQRQMLSEEQKVALDNSLGVPSARVEQPTQKPPSNLPQRSGAKLGTLGVGVFLQPFLLLGLLVL